MIGKLSPHENIELELMLTGKKRVSYFSSLNPDLIIPSKFVPYINSGQLMSEIFDLFSCVIWAPGHQNQAKELIEAIKLNPVKGFDEEHERLTGKLLDYSQEDIDFYINHLKTENILLTEGSEELHKQQKKELTEKAKAELLIIVDTLKKNGIISFPS